MRNFKKIIYLFLVFAFLTSCKSEKRENTEEETTRTVDLIENIDQYEKTLAEEKAKEEEKLSKKEDDKNKKDQIDKNTDAKKDDQIAEKKESKIAKVRIKVFGDIMANTIQNQYAYNKGAGTYDYSDSFALIKDYVSDSDISIANYETTTNPNLAYAGHPRFNTPEAYLKAIADAGFDIVTTANNHSLDSGIEGITTTIEAIENCGMDHVGSMRDESEKLLMKEVNGIKIGFLSYTYGTNGIENLFIPREEVKELNYLHPEKIRADIEEAKDKGADFVVVYPHWGIEYQNQPTEDQIKLARDMAEWGADLIIGNHPHVIQPFEKIETLDGRTAFIAYALGNVISYQLQEVTGNIRSEQSVSYDITLSKNFTEDRTSIENIEANPLWTGLTYNDYGGNVQTYLASEYLDGGAKYDQVNEVQRARIKQAYDMTNESLNKGVIN